MALALAAFAAVTAPLGALAPLRSSLNGLRLMFTHRSRVAGLQVEDLVNQVQLFHGAVLGNV